jgi:hypothetical protein
MRLQLRCANSESRPAQRGRASTREMLAVIALGMVTSVLVAGCATGAQPTVPASSATAPASAAAPQDSFDAEAAANLEGEEFSAAAATWTQAQRDAVRAVLEARIAAKAQKAAPVSTPANATWQVVTKLSGSANKRGETFRLSGADARLSYTVKGSSHAGASIYVVEKGKSLEADGGFAEVVAKAGQDSTMLAKGAGDYYLDVSSANAQWTVVIEELR